MKTALLLALLLLGATACSHRASAPAAEPVPTVLYYEAPVITVSARRISGECRTAMKLAPAKGVAAKPRECL